MEDKLMKKNCRVHNNGIVLTQIQTQKIRFYQIVLSPDCWHHLQKEIKSSWFLGLALVDLNYEVQMTLQNPDLLGITFYVELSRLSKEVQAGS